MKSVFFVISFLFASIIVRAQGFEAYIISGATFSQIEGDDLKGYDNLGFTLGGATNFILKKDFSFQQEIVYYQRGSRNEDGSFTKNLKYVDLILLINKNFREKWVLQVGAGVGKLLGIKTDDTGDQVSFYRLDTFATLGGGYFITDNLLLNARIQYSLLPALKNNARFFNNSIAFTLRWRFLSKD